MAVKHNANAPNTALIVLYTGFWCAFTCQLKKGAIKSPLLYVRLIAN